MLTIIKNLQFKYYRFDIYALTILLISIGFAEYKKLEYLFWISMVLLVFVFLISLIKAYFLLCKLASDNKKSKFRVSKSHRKQR